MHKLNDLVRQLELANDKAELLGSILKHLLEYRPSINHYKTSCGQWLQLVTSQITIKCIGEKAIPETLRKKGDEVHKNKELK